jgi:predicted unusual protein kinase regulating ubiquinone biosynthesis (AarF/ABC1/UbiB family)/nucleotide-binding universal stress UspA family protein
MPSMRVLVATDRSEAAERAVAWAAELAGRYEAELVLLQVLTQAGEHDGAVQQAEESLRRLATEIAGERGRARVSLDPDPSQAIVAAAHDEAVDILVVGNAGMGGRKEFLLGNVPNRVSHAARCTVIIVNTVPQAAEAEHAAAPDAEPAAGKLLGRAARIGKVFAKYGLEETRDPARGTQGFARARAERLRAALEELGPTFAKLGQILSTRSDLLPAELVEELSALQDRVTPLTEAEVVAVMEQELGVPWEDVFESIDPEPLAAGTIGQVHRATLESGDRVVVKVQRPNASDEIMRDLGLLELFAEKAAKRAGLREMIDIPALAEHLSASLRRELDFREEASNLERMREVLAPYDRLAVPRLYPDFSTSRLLVMEEVLGGPIRDAPHGEARTKAARQLLEAYYSQILDQGFFHADPHPGNLMWWDDRIYLIDLGMVGEVEPELRELMLLLLLAFWRNDPKFLAEVMLMLSGDEQPGNLDLDALQSDFAAFIDRFHDHTTLAEIQIGPLLEGLTEIGVRHRMRLPASLALSGKAFGQMQLAVAELDPDLDPFSVINGFLVRGIVQRVREAADPQRVFYEGQKLKLRLSRFVEAVERTAGARPGSRLQVEFIGASEIEDAIQRAGRRMMLAGVVGAALAAGLAAWLTRDRQG